MSTSIAPILEQQRPAIESLCRQYGVRQLEVFGSAARADFNPAGSDIDLLVSFLPTTPYIHAQQYYGLLECFEELLMRKVEMIVSDAIRDQQFLHNIAHDRKVFYTAVN